ncbi:VWA domain-containing protein [Mesorhizobium sp. IMUNJ 23232]|uniref:VWA domain-containing protein n=1 Tax=Mesorhizobium sp. IMUNJ 23232 TaxID=3376064 RepID=UPI0037B05967
MGKDSTGSGKSLDISGSHEIDDFVRLARTVAATKGPASGRLILALDATMSRQPTWDLACHLQGEMFDAVGKAGSLAVQLAYFRGFAECRSSAFVRDTATLKDLMTRIDCRAGNTQIKKILSHTLKETARQKVDALVYIGDAFEEEISALAEQAGKLGLHGVPVFVFQEGRDARAESAFREIARLSKGAWFRFDRAAAATLAKLLASVAVFATGGVRALEARNLPEDRLLIEHMRGGAR